MSAPNGTAALVDVKDVVAVDHASVSPGALALAQACDPCAAIRTSTFIEAPNVATLGITAIAIPLAAAARRTHIGLKNAGTRSYSHVVANAHGASPLASNSSITVVLEQVRALRHASS